MKILQPNSFFAILPAHSIAPSRSSITTRKGTRTLRSVKSEQPSGSSEPSDSVARLAIRERSKRQAMPSMKTVAAISTCLGRGLGLG